MTTKENETTQKANQTNQKNDDVLNMIHSSKVFRAYKQDTDVFSDNQKQEKEEAKKNKISINNFARIVKQDNYLDQVEKFQRRPLQINSPRTLHVMQTLGYVNDELYYIRENNFNNLPEILALRKEEKKDRYNFYERKRQEKINNIIKARDELIKKEEEECKKKEEERKKKKEEEKRKKEEEEQKKKEEEEQKKKEEEQKKKHKHKKKQKENENDKRDKNDKKENVNQNEDKDKQNKKTKQTYTEKLNEDEQKLFEKNLNRIDRFNDLEVKEKVKEILERGLYKDECEIITLKGKEKPPRQKRVDPDEVDIDDISVFTENNEERKTVGKSRKLEVNRFLRRRHEEKMEEQRQNYMQLYEEKNLKLQERLLNRQRENYEKQKEQWEKQHQKDMNFQKIAIHQEMELEKKRMQINEKYQKIENFKKQKNLKLMNQQNQIMGKEYDKQDDLYLIAKKDLVVVNDRTVKNVGKKYNKYKHLKGVINEYFENKKKQTQELGCYVENNDEKTNEEKKQSQDEEEEEEESSELSEDVISQSEKEEENKKEEGTEEENKDEDKKEEEPKVDKENKAEEKENTKEDKNKKEDEQIEEKENKQKEEKKEEANQDENDKQHKEEINDNKENDQQNSSPNQDKDNEPDIDKEKELDIDHFNKNDKNEEEKNKDGKTGKKKKHSKHASKDQSQCKKKLTKEEIIEKVNQYENELNNAFIEKVKEERMREKRRAQQIELAKSKKEKEKLEEEFGRERTITLFSLNHEKELIPTKVAIYQNKMLEEFKLSIGI